MITRRDALKIAAGFAASNAASFAVSPEDAAALLAEPIELAPAPPRSPAWSADVLDPVQFAEALDGIDIESWFEYGMADEMATYRQALNAVVDLYPELANPPGLDHPFIVMDQVAVSMPCGAWMAGVRAGAAYEHLRLALVMPRQTCKQCHGQGRLWAGGPYRHNEDGTNETTCSACDGVGTVATPPPSLAAMGFRDLPAVRTADPREERRP